MNRRGRPRPPSEETLQLERDVLELRRAGIGISAAADQLGVPRSTAHGAYKRALARTLAEPAAEVRALEADRLDRIQAAVWARAMRGDLAAVDRVLRVMERRTELLGLDHKHGIAERALQLEADKVRLVAVAFGKALDALHLDEGQRAAATRVLLAELRAAEHEHDDDGGDDVVAGEVEA